MTVSGIYQDSEQYVIHVPTPMSQSSKKPSSPVQFIKLFYVPIFLIFHLLVVYTLYNILFYDMKIPTIRSIYDLKQMCDRMMSADQLSSSSLENFHEKTIYNKNFFLFLCLFSTLYLFIQTYCIPGSLLLNLAAGALFGTFWGTIMCSLLTALGSTMSYMLVSFVGKEIIMSLLYPLKKRMETMESILSKFNTTQIYMYLLGARLFPFTPNWLLNIALPFLGVNISTFFFTSLIGLLPMNWVTVKAGLTLSELNSLTTDVMEPRVIFIFGIASCLCILLPMASRWSHFKRLNF
jgi:uncharacterized membrane protein YdjX (TVP38/TMEM64 family)